MFGEWDAALVNQDYEINWLISPQYEEVTKRFTEKLADAKTSIGAYPG